ncbi:MAG: AMIN domain-containing protein, partial [Deltaproteobacteria bacterium]|nr:AMIN domain-containing protein [Deltaproteobacteria bacterium]
MLKNITAASTLVLFILLHALLAVAADPKLLEDITFETPSGDEERVIFKLNGVYIPKIFAIKGENPRVVFDFPDIKPARLLNNIINTNGKFIKRIRMGIHYEPKPKTRVVFDLLPDKEVEFKHDFDTKKKALIISVYHAGAEPDSRPRLRKEKKDIVPENLGQEEKTVSAQKPETTETLSTSEPVPPEQEDTSTTTSPPSVPVQTVAQPSEEEVAPTPREIEEQQPEPKLSDAQQEEEQASAIEPETTSTLPAPEQPTDEQKEPPEEEVVSALQEVEAQQPEPELLDTQQEEEQAPATEPETAVTSPAPELPTDEQEKTSIVPPEPSAPVQTVTQPPEEEVVPAPQETEAKQPEPELSDTQSAAQQEEDQGPDPAEAPETDKSSGPPVLNSITFDNSTNRGEMVLFKLNDFQPPIVFGVEEGLPRVVCDFKGAEAAHDVPNVIKTDG